MSRSSRQGWFQREVALVWRYRREVCETWKGLLKAATVLTSGSFLSALVSRTVPHLPAVIVPWLTVRRLAAVEAVILVSIAQYLVWRKRAERHPVEISDLTAHVDLDAVHYRDRGTAALVWLTFNLRNSGANPIVVLGPSLELLKRRLGRWRVVPSTTTGPIGQMHPKGGPDRAQQTEVKRYRFQIAARDEYCGEFHMYLIVRDGSTISEDLSYRLRVTVEVMGDDPIEQEAALEIGYPSVATMLAEQPPEDHSSPKASG